MRLLQVVHQYPPDHVGGTELYTKWLAQALADRGHEVEVFYRRTAEGVGRGHRHERDALRVWTAWDGMPSPVRRFLATFGAHPILRAFTDVVERTSPDLVHVQHLMGLPVSLIRFLRERRVPVVITFHDYWWVCANAQLLTNYSQEVCGGPQGYLNCARCAFARVGHPNLWPAFPVAAGLLAWRNWLLRRSISSADKLISPTEFVGRWYVEHNVPADRTIVIPHGVNPPGRQPREREVDRPVRFAYIGGLSWQKGVRTLVDAFRHLRGRTELWIAGDETFDPQYAARLRAEATPNVRFLGKLSREDVWRTLARVDAVAVPSLWYETFSFVVSEAFAAGVPVVASRLGPLADRVRDGVDGLLVPPNDVSAWRDALQRLVDAPDVLKRLRANVRPPMTLDEHVDRIESVYRAVIAAAR